MSHIKSRRTSDELDRLIDSITLEEQVSLLAGADFWHTVAIDRVGIPAMRVSDGPSGARGTMFNGPESLNVPCGTALAATWDASLVREIGALLGREARSKGARVLLAPTVNLHRTPIGGRNFECMSEDPLLTGATAVAYVDGLQSQGVASCIKHFVGNDTELERMTVDAHIDERTLREMYLKPFEMAVKKAGVLAVMTAYNRLNGPFAADSYALLQETLRDDWGFDGVVMSDWTGLHSTVEGVIAGLDLEMPGPTVHRGEKLLAAIDLGQVTAGQIRQRVVNLLSVMDRLGALDEVPGPETTSDDPADLALIRRAGAASMVVLKNSERVLPLDPSAMRRVAVIGPNAINGQIMGGGSAHVNATSISHPATALLARFAPLGVDVTVTQGCEIAKSHQPFRADLFDGFALEFFAAAADLDDPEAASCATAHGTQSSFLWTQNPANGADNDHRFGLRASTRFTPTVSGDWEFGLSCVGDGALSIDGVILIDNTPRSAGDSFFGLGKKEEEATVSMVAGETYELIVTLRRHSNLTGMTGLTIGCTAPIIGDPMAEAVAAAVNAAVAIVVVGTTAEWESEGWDRTTLALPGRQDELIMNVAAVAQRTVVVVNAGSPVTMPWLEHVDAVVMAWFPGQDFGEALTDILLGDVEPQGRLPVTFPKQLSDMPAYEHYPFRSGVAEYAERLLVGYRWYDTIGREPLFPFGFGLGYARVEIIGAAVVNPHALAVTVANTDDRDGVAVVQVYSHFVFARREGDPDQALVGYATVPVPAHSTATLEVRLDERTYQFWDTTSHRWASVVGPIELRIGLSSRHTSTTLLVEPVNQSLPVGQ